MSKFNNVPLQHSVKTGLQDLEVLTVVLTIQVFWFMTTGSLETGTLQRNLPLPSSEQSNTRPTRNAVWDRKVARLHRRLFSAFTYKTRGRRDTTLPIMS